MELSQLEYFRVLCKYGSYTSAAQELHISQPAISMAVKKLEEECGGDLIDHRQRGVFALTPRGETVHSWAVILHNDYDHMMQDIGRFSSRQREVIRIAFPMPLCPELMTDVIPDYSQHHSDAAIHTIQAGHKAIVSSLIDGQADLGIFCQDMLTDSLDSVWYKDVQFWACLAAGHPLLKCETITPDMLAGETLILPKTENAISAAIGEYFAHLQKPPVIILEDVHPEDVWQPAGRGEGIAFLPEMSRREHCVPLSPPLVSRLVIAWRRDEQLTRQKRELVDYILHSAGRAPIQAGT